MSLKQEKAKSKKKDRMNELANGIFAPIYPIIAENIVNELNILQGVCVDVGSGPGSLAIALAKITDLQMILLDPSKDMHQHALDNIKACHLQNRVRLLSGDVHRIPLESGQVDLVISRGSVFSWEDLEQAFKEIYRILAPGGKSFIGGGFGNKAMTEQVTEQMLEINPNWKKFREKNFSQHNRDRIKNILNGCKNKYKTIEKETEFWIIMEKES